MATPDDEVARAARGSGYRGPEPQAPAGVTAAEIAQAIIDASPALQSPPGAEALGTATKLTALFAGIAVPVATYKAYQLALEGILQGFDGLIRRRMERLQLSLAADLDSEFPGLPQSVLMDFVSAEMDREKAFVAKSRERLERDLPQALVSDDRDAAIRRLLEREQRFLKQRQEAMRERLMGLAFSTRLEQVSPAGAFWRLDPHIDNCPQCKAMAGKTWPWDVLKVFHPPVHPNCACKLWSIQDAHKMGWISDETARIHTMDDVPVGLMESVAGQLGPDEAGADLLVDEVLEARGHYDLRYKKGDEHGGEFMPKRGSHPHPLRDLKRGIKAAEHAHMTGPGDKREPRAPEPARDAKTIKKPVAELQPGDQVNVNGKWDEVREVQASGTIILRDLGAVYPNSGELSVLDDGMGDGPGPDGKPADGTPTKRALVKDLKPGDWAEVGFEWKQVKAVTGGVVDFEDGSRSNPYGGITKVPDTRDQKTAKDLKPGDKIELEAQDNGPDGEGPSLATGKHEAMTVKTAETTASGVKVTVESKAGDTHDLYYAPDDTVPLHAEDVPEPDKPGAKKPAAKGPAKKPAAKKPAVPEPKPENKPKGTIHASELKAGDVFEAGRKITTGKDGTGEPHIVWTKYQAANDPAVQKNGKLDVRARRLPLSPHRGSEDVQLKPDDIVRHLGTEREGRPGLEAVDPKLVDEYEKAMIDAGDAGDKRSEVSNLVSLGTGSVKYDWKQKLAAVGLSEKDVTPERLAELEAAKSAAQEKIKPIQERIYEQLLKKGEAFEVKDHSGRLESKPFEVQAKSETLQAIGFDAAGLRDSGANLRLSRFKTREAAEKALADMNKRELARMKVKLGPRPAYDEKKLRAVVDGLKLSPGEGRVTDQGRVALGNGVEISHTKDREGNEVYRIVNQRQYFDSSTPDEAVQQLMDILHREGVEEPTWPDGLDEPHPDEGEPGQKFTQDNSDLITKIRNHISFVEQYSGEQADSLRERMLKMMSDENAEGLKQVGVDAEILHEHYAPNAKGAKTGTPDFKEIEKHLLTPTIGQLPDDAGPLPIEGFGYLGKGDKVSYKRELRDGTLHLPDGFFRQGRDRREEVIFKHYGALLADSVDLGKLAEKEPRLAKRKEFVNTYYALNSPLAKSHGDVHPESARLVAEAAHQAGLPLSPEGMKFVKEAERAAPEPTSAAPQMDTAQARKDAKRMTDRLSAGNFESGYLTLQADPSFARGHGAADEWINFAGGYAVYFSSAHKRGESVDGGPLKQIDPELMKEILSADRKDVVSVIEKAGFQYSAAAPNGWSQYVNADGRGIAVSPDAKRAWDFTPSEFEVAEAKWGPVAADPVNGIKPAMKAGEVREAMRQLGWNVSVHTDDKGFDMRKGAEDPVRVRTLGKGDDAQVVLVGHPATAQHEVLTQAEWAERKGEEAQVAAGAAATEADAGKAAKAAVDAGDTAKLEKLLKEAPGSSLFSSLSRGLLSEENGFELRKRRDSTRGGKRGRMYKYRTTQGQTVEVWTPWSSSAEPVVKITQPQVTKRTRITRPWKSRQELYEDALGRADQIAKRYDGIANVSTVEDEASKGAVAHHEYNGTIVMADGQYTKSKTRLNTYFKKVKDGTVTDIDHLDMYDLLSSLQHEINHGVGAKDPNGKGYMGTGQAFTPAHYRGAGKAIEEALTEEAARVLTIDWLRENNMTDVLRALKRHPKATALDGSYSKFRAQMKKVMDDANIHGEARRDLMLSMKFEMTPEEQRRKLEEISGMGPDELRNWFTRGRPPDSKREDYQVIEDDPLADIDPEWPDIETPVGTVKVGQHVRIAWGTDAPATGPPTVPALIMGMDERRGILVQIADGRSMWIPASDVKGKGR